MSRERNIELEVDVWAENNGWIVRPMSYRGRRGCPDRFFFGFGVIVAIEFKRPDGEKSAAQIREVDEMVKRKCPVRFFEDKDEAITFLKGFM